MLPPGPDGSGDVMAYGSEHKPAAVMRGGRVDDESCPGMVRG